MDGTIFNDANKEITDDIKEQLRLQGHFLTGALERSIKEIVIETPTGFQLTASAAEYMEDLEQGVPSHQISIDPKSIQELTRYVELRMGYRGKYAQKVAIAILKKQQKEGMPTKNSYQYSKTGERTEAIKDTFYDNQNKYGQVIDSKVAGVLDSEFNTIQSKTF